MSPRISSLVFDKKERPRRATIITSLGTVKVQWVNRCWFATGGLDAKKLAVPVIERIKRLIQNL